MCVKILKTPVKCLVILLNMVYWRYYIKTFSAHWVFCVCIECGFIYRLSLSHSIAQAPTHGGRTHCVTAARWRVCHAPPLARSSSRGLQVNPLHPFRCTWCNAKNVAVTSQIYFLEMCMHCYFYTMGYMCLRDFYRLLIILGCSLLLLQRLLSLWTKPHGLLVNSVG